MASGLCVLLVMAALLLPVVPVWWQTTRVYRAELPHQVLQQWQAQGGMGPLQHSVARVSLDVVPVQLQLQLDAPRLSSWLKQRLAGVADVRVRVLPEAGGPDQAWPGASAADQDQWLSAVTRPSAAPSTYTLFLLGAEKGVDQVTLGAGRSAWLSTPGERAWDSVVSALGLALDQGWLGGVGQAEPEQGVRRRSVVAAPEYRVTFSLLNGDAATSVAWDFGRLSRNQGVTAFVERVSQVMPLRTSSQVRYNVPLGVQPKPVSPKAGANGGPSGHQVTQAQLPLLIHMSDWDADFTATNQPSLSLVVYHSEAKWAPLTVQGSHGHGGDTFIIPRTGGVMLLNPDAATPGSGPRRPLSQALERRIAVNFVRQLRLLLGIDSHVGLQEGKPGIRYVRGEAHIAEWELDRLRHRVVRDNVVKAVASLSALSRQVASLPSLPLGDDLAAAVHHAMHAVNHTVSLVDQGRMQDAVQSSRQALQVAEATFFDPGVLPLLYFPDEYKYAVYLPLLFPIVFALQSSLVREYRRRKRG